MLRNLLWGIFIIALSASGKAYKVTQFNEVQTLSVGDSVTYSPSNFTLTLKKLEKYQSQCAEPGKNCGVAYEPDEKILPHFDMKKNVKCLKGVLPRLCEVAYRVIKIDETKSLSLEFVNPFSFCEKESNLDNRNSCIIRTVKNGSDGTPFSPTHCQDIRESVEARNTCIETVADEIQDAALCVLVAGKKDFACTLLTAKAAKDPTLCKKLRRGPRLRSDADYQNQVSACEAAVKSK